MNSMLFENWIVLNFRKALFKKESIFKILWKGYYFSLFYLNWILEEGILKKKKFKNKTAITNMLLFWKEVADYIVDIQIVSNILIQVEIFNLKLFSCPPHIVQHSSMNLLIMSEDWWCIVKRCTLEPRCDCVSYGWHTKPANTENLT